MLGKVASGQESHGFPPGLLCADLFAVPVAVRRARHRRRAGGADPLPLRSAAGLPARLVPALLDRLRVAADQAAALRAAGLSGAASAHGLVFDRARRAGRAATLAGVARPRRTLRRHRRHCRTCRVGDRPADLSSAFLRLGDPLRDCFHCRRLAGLGHPRQPVAAADGWPARRSRRRSRSGFWRASCCRGSMRCGPAGRSRRRFATIDRARIRCWPRPAISSRAWCS